MFHDPQPKIWGVLTPTPPPGLTSMHRSSR